MPPRAAQGPRPAPGIFAFDEEVRAGGFAVIAGIDEAGRGPLAGPVVAAAVVLDAGDVIKGVRDSKRLTPRRIASLFFEIVCRARGIGLGVVDAPEIDRTDILRATRKAMTLALDDLPCRPDLVLIDAVTIEGCAVPQRAFIRGESVSATIAAASIVAKYTRDSLMRDYHVRYPVYGFDEHKGYGTQAHLNSLRRHGPCPIHRTSFAPVMTRDLFEGDA